MTERWRRSSATPFTSCSVRRANSPIRPPAPCSCALALDEWAQEFCERCRQKGIALGVTRIGAHAGPALVGNFGGDRFFDYTAYGDTINVTARLETANKQLGTRICVSATLAEKVEEFHGRPVGDLVLRGRTEALRAFEPVSGEQYENEAMNSYLEAFAKLEANDPSALAAFAAHRRQEPGRSARRASTSSGF